MGYSPNMSDWLEQSLKEALKEYEQHLRSTRRDSDSTLRTKMRDARSFAVFLVEDDADPSVVREWTKTAKG